jgi:hypothetical protein
MGKQVSRIGVSAMVILLFTAALSAQETTASLRGTVFDATGARVPSAVVTVVQNETGFTRSSASDSNGDYLLVLLPIGHYRLEVAAKGFRNYVQEGISLSVNQAAQVPVHLEVGLAQQVVQVKADAGLITTTNDLGETVNDSETVDLPLNGRNFSQLGLLLPGTAPLTQGLQLAGGSARAGQSYSVNGMRPESNEFLVDGVENYNSINAGFVVKPPPDSISEFRILTNTASAEFGHNAGSNTNIVMRSGSNRLHGDVYEFLRNDAVDARNFFSTNVEPLKQNQFGGTLGGPIRRDKTFLFGYYEGFRNRAGETQLTTVPTADEKQGNFGALCSSYVPGLGYCADPNGTQLVNVGATPPQPIPFNQLDPASINAVSRISSLSILVRTHPTMVRMPLLRRKSGRTPRTNLDCGWITTSLRATLFLSIISSPMVRSLIRFPLPEPMFPDFLWQRIFAPRTPPWKRPTRSQQTSSTWPVSLFCGTNSFPARL